MKADPGGMGAVSLCADRWVDAAAQYKELGTTEKK